MIGPLTKFIYKKKKSNENQKVFTEKDPFTHWLKSFFETFVFPTKGKYDDLPHFSSS